MVSDKGAEFIPIFVYFSRAFSSDLGLFSGSEEISAPPPGRLLIEIYRFYEHWSTETFRTQANILATIGGASILGKVLLGKAADRIGNRQTFIIGFILMLAAFLMVLPTRGELMLSLFAAVYGFGFGGCIASESPIVAELFGLSSHGLILGVVSFSFLLGGAFGPFLWGFIFDMTGSYQWGFLACGVVSFIGLMLTVILKRR